MNYIIHSRLVLQCKLATRAATSVYPAAAAHLLELACPMISGAASDVFPVRCLFSLIGEP